ncbi:flagellar hook-basal body complex protein FliE [bacterium BMS3Bbin06]|nr:flagellar hook-basal body complex protein FliE [bacterium BMS3Abin08]GBE33837.1 flagellar hook-basal body complex protein FliE [bacterium BMS3Bbin06]HDO36641.1 flagellar hook-basal body complex protein FliE [Nitrospirota bacterium]HDY71681.1 flagellar hook-basal body complex protein FliE [Nitrospirota bacterium]HDY72507.1 flagellar hook-basal body complex protein FliE [Nitrospirota bacterium]
MSLDPVNAKPAGATETGGLKDLLKPGEKGTSEGGFDGILDETIGKVASLQKETEVALTELSKGDGDIVKAMVAMQKAEISFQTMVEVRNKLVNAYEEIIRMQV